MKQIGICFFIVSCVLSVSSFYSKSIVYAHSNVMICEETDRRCRSRDDEELIKNITTYNRPLYKKEVFLTFDDGPSVNNTMKILSILKKNDVRATFFIVGKKAEENPKIIQELYRNDMCIGAHSYSHDYKILKSVDLYNKDISKCNETIKGITGESPVPFVRLPGGSDNNIFGKQCMNNIKEELKRNYVRYVDWNVSSADTAASTVPSDIIAGNVINQCREWNFAVVLMHDSYPKSTTVDALPNVISYLKKEGFEFKTFQDITLNEERQMIKLKIMNK